MTTDLNVPMFEDYSVIAFVPVEAYSGVWLVVLEGWDAKRKRIMWYTGLLATHREQLFKRQPFENLQDAINAFGQKAVVLRSNNIDDEYLNSLAEANTPSQPHA